MMIVLARPVGVTCHFGSATMLMMMMKKKKLTCRSS